MLDIYNKQIEIQLCPICLAPRFYVKPEELEDALGCIECENCGKLLFPVDQTPRDFGSLVIGEHFEWGFCKGSHFMKTGPNEAIRPEDFPIKHIIFANKVNVYLLDS